MLGDMADMIFFFEFMEDEKRRRRRHKRKNKTFKYTEGYDMNMR